VDKPKNLWHENARQIGGKEIGKKRSEVKESCENKFTGESRRLLKKRDRPPCREKLDETEETREVEGSPWRESTDACGGQAVWAEMPENRREQKKLMENEWVIVGERVENCKGAKLHKEGRFHWWLQC